MPKNHENNPASAKPAVLTPTAFPIVGIGASAGGLAAFEAFFSGMPADREPGMAFVLVQHLAPDHDSLLAELIQRYTRMKVFEVEDGMQVQINCAYIIPPNRDMAFLNGTLQLLEPAAPRGHRLPIDFLFRSLAQDQHERAIGIVLSGTGSDGTLGVRVIKSEGGMVMVQDPEQSEFDGMPRSAMATGMVDYALKPAEMPAQLIAYVAHAFRRPTVPVAAGTSQSENGLKKICILLRTQTGHDFSQYKTSTIFRRIERRMAIHQVDTIDNYVKYLQQTPVEIEALFRDLLIGVTNFFRDPEAFKVLEEQVVPALFEGKPPGSLVRIWSTGCSTGEEAYSIAMLLHERLEALKQSYKIQVFATDIDSRAIAVARAGIYPASIADDISAERLAHFFTAEADGSTYRVHKNIRDMMVFSEHDLVKDPPFSRMDLIGCRNLLIYMGSELQKKIISLFHYALLPGGVLFLGTSETVGDFANLFVAMDRKAKTYRRNEDVKDVKRAEMGRVFSSMLPTNVADAVLPSDAVTVDGAVEQSVQQIAGEVLLQQTVPVDALVNSINSILKMAGEGLKRDLTTALQTVVASNTLAAAHVTGTNTVNSDANVKITALTEELQAKEEYLRATKKELEASNQELKSSNEEMQSINEELQSTNEELETSKEELQSINEELATVNTELQSKVTDLSRANNDMNNLLAGTGIGTIFVDHRLHILRFTPNVTLIINLIMSDVGRPVGHIVSNLVGYNSLVEDVQAVLDTLIPKDVDVQTQDGKYYTMRILPYRTLDNVIEGAVITFVDITETVRTREALREANELLLKWKS